MTVVLTNRESGSLLQALAALDGRPEAVTLKNAKGGEETKIIAIPYKFGGRTRLALYRWMVAVKAQSDVVTAAHNGLVKEMADPETPDVVAEKNLPAFNAAWTEILNATANFEVALVSAEELNDEANQLPISVLSALSPILR